MSEETPEYNAGYIPSPPSRLKLGDWVWFSNTVKKQVCAINYKTDCVIFDDDIKHANYNEHYAYANETGNNYNQRAYLLSGFVWTGIRWEQKDYSEWKAWHIENGWDDIRWKDK